MWKHVIDDVPLQTRLPTELLYDIIDNLHNDRPALHACTLVAHTWLLPARRNLFRSLHIVQREDGKEPSHITEFAAFLKTSPVIVEIIEELHIQGSIPCPYTPPVSVLPNVIILAIMRDLPRLTSLILEGVRIDFGTPASDDTSLPLLEIDPPPQPCSLTKLAFVDVVMTVDHLSHILSYAGSVQTLHFLYVVMDGCSGPVETLIPDLGIQSLVIESQYLSDENLSAPILFKLIPSLKFTLTSLDTELVSPRETRYSGEEIRFLGPFFAEVGPGLLDLRLDLIAESHVYEDYSPCKIPLFIFAHLMNYI
ncbi:hypothetical protein NLI96_g6818 [Meripilus lineatus]|uniref:F-box domain-containing protein n=1 Tax=Meripilus lineatus TaxID=2056292 RepID=A0AAD5V0K5_9APHY|nr:hypothetical protein NLI96_g6818 [Physisporinus lineatus]